MTCRIWYKFSNEKSMPKNNLAIISLLNYLRDLFYYNYCFMNKIDFDKVFWLRKAQSKFLLPSNSIKLL